MSGQMREDVKTIGRGSLLAMIGGTAAVVVALVVGGMAVFGIGWFKKETADFRGSVAATERVHANGAYRIAAYDQFFDRCAGVQAKEATIAALKQERTTASEGRQQQIDATLTAVRSARAQDITRYNADAAKTDTVGNFLASNLPYSLDVNQENTTCAR